MIVLSPHLDDAVWSCHGLLEGATVVTICAGIPSASTPPTQFDKRAGFRSAANAMRARRREDEAAAVLAGFTVRHLNYLDHGYGVEQDMVSAVEEALADVGEGEPVIGPLGLRHPDHQRIAYAFAAVAHRDRLNAWLYEELPYAYVWPENLAPALRALLLGEYTVTRCSVPEKADAVNAYRSQTTGAHMDAILAPERYHPLREGATL